MNRSTIPVRKIKIVILLAMLFLPVVLYAQTVHQPRFAPDKKDFALTLQRLSSNQMEGREAGTRGASLASEFIAEKMRECGLHPYGDFVNVKNAGSERNWFENFEAVTYKADRDSMALLINTDGNELKFKPDEAEVVNLRNVIGIIRGKDTTSSIIIGAHYDHLGIRDGNIYYGADDNASGVSGLLALAKAWSGYKKKPPCNIIFASWTGEEKGEIGSKYFVQHLNERADHILFSLNMDMISRSAPEDTSGKVISIGTLPESENLRQLAKEANLKMPKHFELDLWDVTNHFGSDYTYFAMAGIPVMTFFSGFNADYHTPRDIVAKVDLQKMSDILQLVNECIWKVTEKIRTDSLYRK